MAKSLLSVPSIVPTLSVILGIPWLGTQACKRPNDSCAGSSLTEAECASPSGRETPSLMSSSKEIELTVSEEDRLLDTVEEGRLLDISEEELRHSIFLSHSGAQKNFVEQLCEDLERAKQRPFFDKRPQSLPKGEIFAQYIFNAAQQCELAIVVVSEEYFSRSKWPMTELCAFVQSGKCKILPLFFGLSCKDFGNSERRQRWFRTWDAWAQADPRIRLEDWKNALRELERRNGLEYVEALGEVVFRKDVVATACTIIQKSIKQKSLEDEVSGLSLLPLKEFLLDVIIIIRLINFIF